MQIDLKREAMQGWLVLGAVAVVATVLMYVAWDGGELAGQVAAEKAKLGTTGTPISDLVRRQQEANASLAQTIQSLKDQVGFSIEKGFKIEDRDEEMYRRQPGYYFVDRRLAVFEALDLRAREKGITDYDKYIGFGAAIKRPPSDTPPDNAYAADLLKMLQLTEKVVRVCLETPTPLQRLIVQPRPVTAKPELVTPPGRPPLLREYSLTVDIRGSLKDVLWILHRLSPGRDAAADDYSLVLKSLKLTSLNITPIQDIPQLDLVLTVAGMEFLANDERDKAPSASAGTRRAQPTSTAPAAATPIAPGARSF